MQRKGSRVSRDPYFYWKIINMVLACVILILALLILFGGKGGILIPVEFFLGALMCTLSGIMELAKSKRVTGYFCSIVAGILCVALVGSLVWAWVL